MKRILRALGRALKRIGVFAERVGAFVAAAFPWIMLGVMITGIGWFVTSGIKVPAWAAFLCFMVGGIFGLLIASMCAVSGRADDHLFRVIKHGPEKSEEIREALGIGA